MQLNSAYFLCTFQGPFSFSADTNQQNDSFFSHKELVASNFRKGKFYEFARYHIDNKTHVFTKSRRDIFFRTRKLPVI